MTFRLTNIEFDNDRHVPMFSQFLNEGFKNHVLLFDDLLFVGCIWGFTICQVAGLECHVAL